MMKADEDVFLLSEHVDDLSAFADGFPFLLENSLDFDGAGLQDHFAALGVEEGAELVRAGYFGGVVGLLWSLVWGFSRLGSHMRDGWVLGTLPGQFEKGPFRWLCLRMSYCGRSLGRTSHRRNRACWCIGLERRRCAPSRWWRLWWRL